MKKITNRLQILLKGVNFGKVAAIVLTALSFYSIGVSDYLIYMVLGISSSLVIDCSVAVICACIFLSFVAALNFQRENARDAIKISKKIAFAAAFTLLTYMAAPIIFIVSASAIYGEWKLLIFSIIGSLPAFISVLIFTLSFKDIHRGLRKEINYRNPPSIL